MIYTERELLALELSVKSRISEKRFNHTLGVVRFAKILAEKILPDKVTEIVAAAYLHDIAKEIAPEELKSMVLQIPALSKEDIDTPPAYHAFVAPLIVERDFPDFATEDIKSALFNHTLGADDMSVFDRIIFVSDFVEEGRRYQRCIDARGELLLSLANSRTQKEALHALNAAVASVAERTCDALTEMGVKINVRTLLTKNAFSALN